MQFKPAVNHFLEKHHVLIIKTFGFAGSMLGSYLGQRVGTAAVGRMLDATDQPKTPDRLKDRSLLDETGRYEMVVVYHDADKAGPHIDVHIGHMSLLYRVKPVLKDQLSFNKEGYLTQKSQKLILDHIRQEIGKNARVPQNLNHSADQAVFGWVNGGAERNGYGAGATRQVVHRSLVDVFKIGNAVEFYAPQLNPDTGMYIYQLYPGSDKQAPILIWGNRTNNPPEFKDRLHLKMLDSDDLAAANKKIDWSTSTAKYDGSSTYLEITPSGARAWSPRKAKSTGKQIEYTHKLPGLADVRSDQTVIAMGEVLFRGNTGGYVSGSVISGLLNSNKVLPTDVTPEIRLYRVDKVGSLDTHDLPFEANRELQEMVSGLAPELIKPVELMTPHQAKIAGLEGIVVAPPGKSVIDGYKVKWWRDANDWRIDKVKLVPGEKGRVAGVIACTSLESNRQFNLGATAIGNEFLTKRMMENPDLYEGTVIKVRSRHGHEGRSAKVMGVHDDKGKAPV